MQEWCGCCCRTCLLPSHQHRSKRPSPAAAAQMQQGAQLVPAPTLSTRARSSYGALSSALSAFHSAPSACKRKRAQARRQPVSNQALLQALAAQRCISAAVSLHGEQPKSRPAPGLWLRPQSPHNQLSGTARKPQRQCPHLGHIAHGEARVGILDALRQAGDVRRCVSGWPQPVKPDGQAWDGGGNLGARAQHGVGAALHAKKAAIQAAKAPPQPSSVFPPTPSSTTGQLTARWSCEK